MNERINELALQARIHADRLIGSGLSDTTWQDEYHEKFAELLIQECITKAEQEEDRYFEIGEVDLAYAMKNFQNLLKQDFGVEE